MINYGNYVMSKIWYIEGIILILKVIKNINFY